MPQPTPFYTRAREELNTAFDIVLEHDTDGENVVVPVEQMFPHGIQDILFVIWQKTGRMLGYAAAKNYGKVYAELQDVVNYAAFGLAILRSRSE